MSNSANSNTAAMAAPAVYDHNALETKWLQAWEESGLFQQTERPADLKEKLFLLFAFAYPSGAGLHVGHVESKTALDILARYHRMNGKDVFFPVGWDAFGLPAENYAIKTGVPPVKTTKDAINTFRRQIKRLAISYDWANEIATCHPEYYKWTQWIFLQLYRKGLAYRGMGSVNWCPQDQTVLANEQVVDGCCERCGAQVVQKNLEQWYFQITKYQDELISGLDQVDWPEATKHHQLNWIGKSEGAKVSFSLVANGQTLSEKLEIFTTAHDTIFGCTFMVLAPEHTLLKTYQDQLKNAAEIAQYRQETEKKTELDRQVQKEKTGVLVEGIEAINPLTGQAVPIYVADYVLATYGTGAIMAVPGHDERDAAFAKKYQLPVVFVTNQEGFISYADIKADRQKFTLKNSGRFDGLDFVAGRQAILDELVSLGVGSAHNQFKLRDWLISRQRYWGAPIPIVYDPEGNAHPVKEEHLPWMLPTDVDFKPTGESPLKSSQEFVERTERLYGKGWRPEFDTMDTFVDSSWYFLRYTDARNSTAFADPAQIKKWLPVDLYMIGPEHIVLHLLYARFFTKFLRDEGYLSFDEPFAKMRHQGMILGPDGKKMSKSKGNVINPDDIVQKFGADTLRVYEMFMGPLESDKPWSVTAVAGVYRFLNRLFQLSWQALHTPQQPNQVVTRKLHQTLKKVSQDIPKLKFNTAIAAMMELVNVWAEAQTQQQGLSQEQVGMVAAMMAPFAPFMAEELHQIMKEKVAGSPNSPDAAGVSIHQSTWPAWDEKLAVADQVTVVIQVNGKVRDQIVLDADQAQLEAVVTKLALDQEVTQTHLKGQAPRKTIFVPGRVVNFVV